MLKINKTDYTSDYFFGKKCKVKSEFESELYQKYLFKLGYSWANTDSQEIFTDRTYFFTYVGLELKFTGSETFFNDHANVKIEFIDHIYSIIRSNLQETKFKIKDQNHSDKIQKMLFEFDIEWLMSEKEVIKSDTYLYISKGLKITHDQKEDFFNNHNYREIDIDQYLNLMNNYMYNPTDKEYFEGSIMKNLSERESGFYQDYLFKLGIEWKNPTVSDIICVNDYNISDGKLIFSEGYNELIFKEIFGDILDEDQETLNKITLEEARVIYNHNDIDINIRLISRFKKSILEECDILETCEDTDEKISGYYIELNSNIKFIKNQSIDLKSRNVFALEKQAISARAMSQLSQLMFKLGDECNIDWNDDSEKFVIVRKEDYITGIINIEVYSFLAFKTEHIRDNFLNEHINLLKEYFMI